MSLTEQQRVVQVVSLVFRIRLPSFFGKKLIDEHGEKEYERPYLSSRSSAGNRKSSQTV